MTRWTVAEVGLLVQLDRETGGRLRDVVRLAAGRLPRGRLAIRDKMLSLGLGMKARKQREQRDEARRAEGVKPSLVAWADMPLRCSVCGGHWRREVDPEAGVLMVCWGCGRTEFVN